MSDHEILSAYESDFARQAASEPPEPPCPCGAVTDGPEDSGLCRECWLLTLPDCACCGGSPGTEFIGEDLRLCWKCERRYNAGEWVSENDDEPAPPPVGSVTHGKQNEAAADSRTRVYDAGDPASQNSGVAHLPSAPSENGIRRMG